MKRKFQLLVVTLLLISNFTIAQTIDNFNYTGNLIANGWSAHSGGGTNPISTTAGLTYQGYISSGIGNAALIQNLGGEDVNQNAGVGPYSNNGDAIYFSFMVNVTESGTKTGDYFIHIGNRTSSISFTSFCARVFAKVSAGVVNFGLSNTSTATYGTTNFATNTTYLLVVKYVINTSGNDQTDLWVFSSGVPASEAAAGVPEVSNSSTLGQDIVNAIALRQGSASTSVQTVVDGIRLDISWSGLLGQGQSSLVAPVANSATNVTATSFKASWNSVNSATNYWLDVSKVSDFSSFISGYNMKDVGNVTSYDISLLEPNTKYYYRVHASNSTGTSPNSNTVIVTTVVAAPVAKEASDITSTGFSANWNISSGATEYFLDVSSTPDFSNFVSGYENKNVGNVTTHAISSLTTAKTYYYRVRAANLNGTSSNSNSISAITGELQAPTALVASNISTNEFTANWTIVAGATKYFLDVSTSSNFSSFVAGYNAKDVGNVTRYKVTSLNLSTVYYYRIIASNSGGISPYSNTITTNTLLAAPVATSATNITSTGFTVNWNALNGASKYWIDISTKDDFSTILSSYNNKLVDNVTTFNVTGLLPNTTYYFRVCASNSGGTSPYSNTIIIVTKVTGISDDLSAIPNTFELYQNYPNPFNPTTTIKYQIPENAFVALKVYDITGREISTIVNDFKSAGTYEVKFDSERLPSGIYISKIEAGKFIQIKKMILIK